jgi:DNA-directed RNA polymerase subunit H
VLVLGGFLAGKSDHEIVPVHEKLDYKQAQEVLKEKSLKIENLPKIFESDPQAKKLGAKAGNVLRIHRKDGENAYLYYRVVIEG